MSCGEHRLAWPLLVGFSLPSAAAAVAFGMLWLPKLWTGFVSWNGVAAPGLDCNSNGLAAIEEQCLLAWWNISSVAVNRHVAIFETSRPSTGLLQ